MRQQTLRIDGRLRPTFFLVNGGILALSVTFLSSTVPDQDALWWFEQSFDAAFVAFLGTAVRAIFSAEEEEDNHGTSQPDEAGESSNSAALVRIIMMIIMGLSTYAGFALSMAVSDLTDSKITSLQSTMREPPVIEFYFSPPAVEPLP